MEKNKCSLQFVKTLVDFLKGAETVLNQLKLFDRSIRIWWLKHRLTYKKQVYERDKKKPTGQTATQRYRNTKIKEHAGAD